jgi:hypothetical protein
MTGQSVMIDGGVLFARRRVTRCGRGSR